MRELIPWQIDQWKAKSRAAEALAHSASVAQGLGDESSGAVGEGDVDWEKIRKELEGDKVKSA